MMTRKVTLIFGPQCVWSFGWRKLQCSGPPCQCLLVGATHWESGALPLVGRRGESRGTGALAEIIGGIAHVW